MERDEQNACPFLIIKWKTKPNQIVSKECHFLLLSLDLRQVLYSLPYWISAALEYCIIYFQFITPYLQE